MMQVLLLGCRWCPVAVPVAHLQRVPAVLRAAAAAAVVAVIVAGYQDCLVAALAAAAALVAVGRWMLRGDTGCLH
jgi:hypothetical protein